MSTPDPGLWRSMLGYLRENYADICRKWFEELEPLWLDAGLLQIRVANQVQQQYLTNTCMRQFTEAAQAITGRLLAVIFVNGEGVETRRRTQAAPASEDRLDVDQIVISPDYCFENFVTGPGNHLAYAASVAVSHQPGKAYNPLFIHGGVGLGKTHLLQAICQSVLQADPATRICYLSCDSFINQFIESVSDGKMNEFRHRYRHVDLLVIDDIHFLADRERTQEEFFHTFNTLYQANKQIVLSSDSPPNEIPQLEERLISRFNWGLVARVDKPCYETRVAIVRMKAAVRNIEMPDDVVCYIASKIESNTRELEGAITKIQGLAQFNQEPMTLALAQQALGDASTVVTNGHISIQTIIDAVVDFYGVKLSDLQSKRRHRSITVPRQICMYLARERTTYSLEEIGGYFGGRDHTTVMHAIRTVGDRLESDRDFADQINHIDQQVKETQHSRR